MSDNPRKPNIPTKKHLARQEVERRQRRYIQIGTIVVVVLVVLVIIFGILNETVIKARQPVATVNGESISTTLFEDQARYTRYTLIQDANSAAQTLSFLGGDPNFSAQFIGQIQQIQSQLNSPEQIGQLTLNRLTEDAVIRQEAARRGIVVSEAEVDEALQGAFGYFPDGTPTPSPTFESRPTATLSALQLTLTAPTATPVITITPEVTATALLTPTPTLTAAETFTPTASSPLTPTATLAPTATPTPYTQEGYEQTKQETFDTLTEQFGLTEDIFRYVIEAQLYRERLQEAIAEDEGLTQEQDQVWARHILVPDQQTAIIALSRVNAGEDFCTVAAELSTDTSNKDRCGDLGWFGPGRMVAPFEEAAFALEVGELSDPVQTDFGWHIIQVLGHEVRTLNPVQYQQNVENTFQEWLNAQQEAAEIDIREDFAERVPAEPTLPPEFEQAIQELIAQQQQQQFATPGAPAGGLPEPVGPQPGEGE